MPRRYCSIGLRFMLQFTFNCAVFLLLQKGVWSNDSLTASDCRPIQVHLALTNDPSEMRVMWKTSSSGCTPGSQYSVGAWNKTSFLQKAAVARKAASYSSDTYTPEDMCGSPAADYVYDPPPYLHSTILTGLIPGHVHTYDLGDGNVRHFRAAPEPGPDARISFAVYGDMGESTHASAKSPGGHLTSSRVQREIENGALDFVLHVGDISYANGDPRIWDTFMEVIEPYAAVVPYMIAIGNHEYDWRTGSEKRHSHKADPSGAVDPYDPDWGNFGNDSGGECGVAVAKRFIMPNSMPKSAKGLEGKNEPPNAPFWYSFQYGPVHMIVLSTEHDLSASSRQQKWMLEEMARVDRCVTPWLVVAMHRPMYVIFPHKSNRRVGEHLQQELESSFAKFGVDVVLSGHVHSYSRTCNVVNNICLTNNREGGATHVVVGCGGHKLSSVDFDRDDVFDYAEAEFGYVRMSVDGDRRILLEYVYSDHGAVGDTKEIPVPNERCKSQKGTEPEPVVRLDLGSNTMSFNTTSLRTSAWLSQPATVELKVTQTNENWGVQLS
eukprot:jgi/Botrbrau1/16427/Bobra.0142s0026.1